jgi:predicted SAM-dependent methyltransferase
MIRLNLGCGDDIKEDWVNCDLYSDDDKVLRVDMNVLPLPFVDNSVDVILLNQVLEHLSIHPFEFIVDCHRILKKGGELNVIVPAFDVGLPHLRGFHTSNYMDTVLGVKKSSPGYHNRARFELISLEKRFRFTYLFLRIINILRTLGVEDYSWRLRKI